MSIDSCRTMTFLLGPCPSWCQKGSQSPTGWTLSTKARMAAQSHVSPLVLGQDMRGAEELRCKRQNDQSQVQKYRDLARVGEVRMVCVMKGFGERLGACLQLAGVFLRWVTALQVSRAMWCQPQRWSLCVGCSQPCVLLFQGLRKILLEEQRRAFLQRALHAVRNGPMHISQAGLVFLYAILGEAGRLMGHKVSSHVGECGEGGE